MRRGPARDRALLWSVRALLVGCIVATLAVTATAAVASAHDVRGGVRAAQPAGASASPLRQAYDLLLDRFVTPLSPSRVLLHTAEGMLAQIGEGTSEPLVVPAFALTVDRDAAWGVLSAWLDLVAARTAPALDRAALDQLALRSMARAMDERHTRYLSAPQHEQFQALRRGEAKYVGIGTRIRQTDATVVEVFDKSPAERAGLRAGDVVRQIDGQPIAEDMAGTISERLRGQAGESVEIEVERLGSAEPLRLLLVREEVRIPFVRSRLTYADDGTRVGYIQVRNFAHPSVDDEFGRALGDMHARSISALVVDLRGNGGGRLDVGVRMASRFVADGPLFHQVDRLGRTRTTQPLSVARAPRVPMVILADGGTASMGEIFSAALQEAGVARVIGGRTSGSVAGAQTFPLADGSAVQITVLAITSGRGTVLNGVGVTPDESIEPSAADLRLGVDVQLDRALGYLRDAVRDAARPAAALQPAGQPHLVLLPAAPPGPMLRTSTRHQRQLAA